MGDFWAGFCIGVAFIVFLNVIVGVALWKQFYGRPYE